LDKYERTAERKATTLDWLEKVFTLRLRNIEGPPTKFPSKQFVQRAIFGEGPREKDPYIGSTAENTLREEAGVVGGERPE